LGLLDDLVFERRDRERALAAVFRGAFSNERPYREYIEREPA
jgi:hypothetical protein